MAGASPATTMIRLGKPMHSCHGSGAPCGDPVWETGNHARLHSIFHSPAESCGGKRGREKAWRGGPRPAAPRFFSPSFAAAGLCWRMKDRVQSGMVTCLPDRVPARGATTMTRMHRLAKPYHGSGRACPCHVSPTYSPTSRIRQQSPQAASLS